VFHAHTQLKVMPHRAGSVPGVHSESGALRACGAFYPTAATRGCTSMADEPKIFTAKQSPAKFRP